MTKKSRSITLKINFSLPFTSKEIFDFVIKSSNMYLYTGFFLIPGIVDLVSSDAIRKKGTIDYITNTDQSSRESTTAEFEHSHLYGIHIGNITLSGWKKKLAC